MVNVIGKPEFRKAMSCAKTYPPEVDEMAVVGLETAPFRKVSAPRIVDAVGWIEAAMEEEIVGENYSVIVGRVLCSEVNDLFWTNGKLTEDPLVMLAPHFRTLGDRIAKGEEFINRSTHPEMRH